MHVRKTDQKTATACTLPTPCGDTGAWQPCLLHTVRLGASLCWSTINRHTAVCLWRSAVCLWHSAVCPGHSAVSLLQISGDWGCIPAFQSPSCTSHTCVVVAAPKQAVLCCPGDGATQMGIARLRGIVLCIHTAFACGLKWVHIVSCDCEHVPWMDGAVDGPAMLRLSALVPPYITLQHCQPSCFQGVAMCLYTLL